MKTPMQNETDQLRTSAGEAVLNTILRQIPQSEFDALEPHLEFVSLDLGTSLLRENEQIDKVYFMNTGIASLIVETPEGRSVEVGVSGREDLVGLPVVAGLSKLMHHVVVQVPGDGFRVSTAILKRIIKEAPELLRILLLRLAIRAMQMAQNTACNRLHNVKPRLARWLLATQDRIESNVIVTTHDFLARMVGTDRPSVSVAVAALQRDDAITSSRGSISIRDRQKLERHSCECYAILGQFNAELGLA
jgi:CRP-like cAMP-binding protein